MSVQYYTLPGTEFRMSPNQERQYNEIRHEARMGQVVVECACVGDDWVRGLQTVRVTRPTTETKRLTA